MYSRGHLRYYAPRILFSQADGRTPLEATILTIGRKDISAAVRVLQGLDEK